MSILGNSSVNENETSSKLRPSLLTTNIFGALLSCLVSRTTYHTYDISTGSH